MCNCVGETSLVRNELNTRKTCLVPKTQAAKIARRMVTAQAYAVLTPSAVKSGARLVGGTVGGRLCVCEVMPQFP